MITLHTNMGDIGIELDFANTPHTAENFLKLAQEGFYDGLIFHRVINDFMIQGGGFDVDMRQKNAPKTLENEADKAKPNKCYTVAMARTSDPHSASSQFFINVKDNDFLNHRAKSGDGWGYCVFGKVFSGMEVVDKIKLVKTGRHASHQDVPVEQIIIEKVTIAQDPAAGKDS